MLHVDLQLLEAGRLAHVAGRVVRDAVAAAHRVVGVAVAHDVAHAAAHRTHNQPRQRKRPQAFILKVTRNLCSIQKRLNEKMKNKKKLRLMLLHYRRVRV